ncbi:hypothetical protein ABT040_16160 [Streptomyces sp. NPDC002688]|uniref:hypothetical protein n=1 Tax=Streptomyces sp. NPDC002688 TaxID=3154423 RepID=UPI003325D758
MHCITSQLVKNASRPCNRVVLGSNAPQEDFSSTWTWAAAISLIGLMVSVGFTVYKLRKRRTAEKAERLKPDYNLLDEVAVVLDKLADMPAQKPDLSSLSELRTRVKQAERRSPDLRFGDIVARIDVYQKRVLPDCFGKKLSNKRVTLEELMALSRQQGAAITEIRIAIDAVQAEIDRRTK